MDFSIVICTYNREFYLRHCLESLAALSYPTDDYEIIVADNNSVDNTKQVVADFQKNMPNLKYIFESQQGASAARNTGSSVAQGKYLAFLDDECVVPSDWLRIAKELTQQYPNLAFFGGPYSAWYPYSKPNWYKDSYGSFHPLNHFTYPLIPPDYLPGGNLFIEQDSFKMVGGFNKEMGPKANRVAFGEDTFIQMEIQRLQPMSEALYDPRLELLHAVRPEKMKLWWLLKYRIKQGLDQARILEQLHSALNWKGKLVEYVMHGGYHGLQFINVIRFIRRDKKLYPHIANYLYERTFFHISYAVKFGTAIVRLLFKSKAV